MNRTGPLISQLVATADATLLAVRAGVTTASARTSSMHCRSWATAAAKRTINRTSLPSMSTGTTLPRPGTKVREAVVTPSSTRPTPSAQVVAVKEAGNP